MSVWGQGPHQGTGSSTYLDALFAPLQCSYGSQHFSTAPKHSFIAVQAPPPDVCVRVSEVPRKIVFTSDSQSFTCIRIPTYLL